MSKRIVLLENSKTVLQMLHISLYEFAAKNDVVFKIFRNPKIFLKKIENRAIDYDLLISDTELPSMSGLEAAKAAKSQNSKKPVLLITYKAGIKFKRLCRKSEIDDIVEEPFENSNLSNKLKELLNIGLL